MIDLACTTFYLTAAGSISLWITHVVEDSNSKAVSCLQQRNEEVMQEVSGQRRILNPCIREAIPSAPSGCRD